MCLESSWSLAKHSVCWGNTERQGTAFKAMLVCSSVLSWVTFCPSTVITHVLACRWKQKPDFNTWWKHSCFWEHPDLGRKKPNILLIKILMSWFPTTKASQIVGVISKLLPWQSFSNTYNLYGDVSPRIARRHNTSCSSWQRGSTDRGSDFYPNSSSGSGPERPPASRVPAHPRHGVKAELPARWPLSSSPREKL